MCCNHNHLYLEHTNIAAINCTNEKVVILFGFNGEKALDDDEVAMLMIKADRNAEQRARYNANPLDEEVDEELLQKELYQEEFDYLVGHDFMKEMSASLQEENKRKVDRRTLHWVKRAAGLNRKDYHSPHAAMKDEIESDDDGRPKK